jgi:hypothetical protein
MKAIIKIVTANKDFDDDQKQIMRRVMSVLHDHRLSVCIIQKKKEIKVISLKAI